MRERYQARHQVDPEVEPVRVVGLCEVEGQMGEVEHGDAVELVLPGVHELVLDVVVALRPSRAGRVARRGLDPVGSRGEGAEVARVDVEGGALFGEVLPLGQIGRVRVAEAELDGSDLQGGFVGGLEREFGGGFVVGFLRHEPHRLVERAFADDPCIPGPVLLVECAVDFVVQGEEDVHDWRISVRVNPPRANGLFEHHVHDHLADLCGNAHDLFVERFARDGSDTSVVSRTGLRSITQRLVIGVERCSGCSVRALETNIRYCF